MFASSLITFNLIFSTVEAGGERRKGVEIFNKLVSSEIKVLCSTYKLLKISF